MKWMVEGLGVTFLAWALVACGHTPEVQEEPDEEADEAMDETKDDDAQATEESGDGDAAGVEDPFSWLEEVEGEEALGWVEAQNEATLAVLTAHPEYEAMRGEAEALLNAEDRIPYGTLRGDYVYNFWKDVEHERGLWRRAPREDYLAGPDAVTWEVLLDVDALAEEEGENWVYQGTSCLPPDFERCLIELSIGGKDASYSREFDLTTKSFIAPEEGGFYVSEAKHAVDWIDEDTLLIGTDFGEGTTTDSGYPRTTRVWKRGEALTEAPQIFEVEQEAVAAWPWVWHSPDFHQIVLYRSIDFYNAEITLLDEDLETKTTLPLPTGISVVGFFDGQLLLKLRKAWTVDGELYEQGALLSVDVQAWLEAEDPSAVTPAIEAVVVPTETMAVSRVAVSKNALIVTLLEDVKNRIVRLERDDAGAWVQTEISLPGDFGLAYPLSVDTYHEDFFVNFESPLTPEALYYHADPASDPVEIASLPERFDPSGIAVEQRFATSPDGTAVPYYMMYPEDMALDGENPTILYGYGGFEVSMSPYYSATRGMFWVTRGGVYAVANIRGGGEYGPRWHQAALKTERQKAFDDFHAVAEDLIAQGITTPEHLGIHGGSNGGLLVGVAFTQRPELYGGVVCEVPLLDMMRYHLLLAGASWMAEYGDPEDPEEGAFLASISPYHNVDADTAYPRVFFTTSTADDRVHPGHARKMAAKMLEQGHEILYFENIEGGHGAASNNAQLARRLALIYVYMMQELGLGEE